MSIRPLLLTALAGLAAIALALLALNVTSNVIASGYMSARSIGASEPADDERRRVRE